MGSDQNVGPGACRQGGFSVQKKVLPSEKVSSEWGGGWTKGGGYSWEAAPPRWHPQSHVHSLSRPITSVLLQAAGLRFFDLVKPQITFAHLEEPDCMHMHSFCPCMAPFPRGMGGLVSKSGWVG